MEDWKSAHLAWLLKHSGFCPKDSQLYTESHFDIMKQIYSKPACSQEFARTMFLRDLEWYRKSQRLEMELLKQLDSNTEHFVTIGFNHQTWSIQKCVSVIENILSFDWINKAKAVFELYRVNGEHPHVHILLESVLPKSKILEKIWATKGIKKVVLSKSFIDYKSKNQSHDNYINGQKTDEKMKYVQMDSEWREKNNIPHCFQK